MAHGGRAGRYPISSRPVVLAQELVRLENMGRNLGSREERAHELKRCVDDLARAVIVVEDVEGVATIGMRFELHTRTELLAGYKGVDRVVDARPVEPSLGDEHWRKRVSPALKVSGRRVFGEIGGRGCHRGPANVLTRPAQRSPPIG